MTDIQAIADRVEIEALRGDSIDAQMMDDYDRFASLKEDLWDFSGRAYVPSFQPAAGLSARRSERSLTCGCS